MPVALIGLIGYVVDPRLAARARKRDDALRDGAFTLIGFGFSAYLTYRELFSIHAICEWCASSAVMMTIIMCLSIWRFLRGDAGSSGPRRRLDVGRSEPTAPLGAARLLSARNRSADGRSASQSVQ